MTSISLHEITSESTLSISGGPLTVYDTTSVSTPTTASAVFKGGLLLNDKLGWQTSPNVHYLSSSSGSDFNLSSLNNTSSGQTFNMFTSTSDGNQTVSLRLWSKGNPLLSTNTEFIQFAYDSSLGQYTIKAASSGSGVNKPLTVSVCSSLSNQLVLSPDGSVLIAGKVSLTNTSADSLLVQGSATIRGNLTVGSTTISYNNEDVISQQTITLSNNQTTPQTLITFSSSKTLFLWATVSISISNGTVLVESISFVISKKSTGYTLSYTSTGDVSGVDFTITTDGRLQYTSTNQSNYSSSSFAYKASSFV